MSAQARVRRWLEARRADWNRLEQALPAARRGGLEPAAAEQVVQDFRALARDVAVARRELPRTDLVARLESLLQGLHGAIHREHEPLAGRIGRLYAVGVPQAMQRLRGAAHAVWALFILMIGAAWLLVHVHPELATLFASEEMINGVQQGELWTEGIVNVVPSSVVSAGIIANNVMVALFAFGLGAFYGIGTLYIVLLNGAMLGAVFAMVGHHGLAGALFSFVVAHGVVELSVIVLAAAAGVQLGEALARPGQRTRAEAFQAAVGDAGTLLAVVVPALFVAGMIEGFVSTDERIGLPARMAIGAASGLLLWLSLRGAFWRPKAAGGPLLRP